MGVSRVTLQKNGRRAVLQGMWHVAPFAFYENIQLDIDNATDRGDQIFQEGITIEDLPEPETFNEKLIRSFWRYWFASYDLDAELKGWQRQRECLTYPESAVLADIDLAEMARLLDKNGFRCKFPVGLLLFTKSALHPELIDAIEKGIDMAEGKPVAPPEGWKGKDILARLLKPYGRKLYPVILMHRNMVAMDIIKNRDVGGNIFVTYGDAHIPGLINLFLMDGWAVEGTKEIDPISIKKPIIVNPTAITVQRIEGLEVEVENT